MFRFSCRLNTLKQSNSDIKHSISIVYACQQNASDLALCCHSLFAVHPKDTSCEPTCRPSAVFAGRRRRGRWLPLVNIFVTRRMGPRCHSTGDQRRDCHDAHAGRPRSTRALPVSQVACRRGSPERPGECARLRTTKPAANALGGSRRTVFELCAASHCGTQNPFSQADFLRNSTAGPTPALIYSDGYKTFARLELHYKVPSEQADLTQEADRYAFYFDGLDRSELQWCDVQRGKARITRCVRRTCTRNTVHGRDVLRQHGRTARQRFAHCGDLPGTRRSRRSGFCDDAY